MNWWIFWTALNLGWLAGFAIGEGYALYTGGLTLSSYVWRLSEAWGPFQFFLGMVAGGLAVHFFWHWLPPGSTSQG
jgi:hypothetical protein